MAGTPIFFEAPIRTRHGRGRVFVAAGAREALVEVPGPLDPSEIDALVKSLRAAARFIRNREMDAERERERGRG